ncbi:MAG: hypothetical protein KA223_02530 [Candidatus Accumulibacter sp.]|nr:hypothetical protein [Accumulibacter sp.]
MIELIIGFVVGAALGAAGYRFALKRNPAMVEKIAAEIKAKGDEYL